MADGKSVGQQNEFEMAWYDFDAVLKFVKNLPTPPPPPSHNLHPHPCHHFLSWTKNHVWYTSWGVHGIKEFCFLQKQLHKIINDKLYFQHIYNHNWFLLFF